MTDLEKLLSEATPGPWREAYLDQNDQRVVRAAHFEICTCWHHCVGSIENEMEANARLVALAPDLAAALIEAEKALAYFSAWDQCWPGNINLETACNKCRAALDRIRKITGGE